MYNDGKYLVTKFVDVVIDDGNITVSVPDSDIPDSSVEYQLINIFIPDDTITSDVSDDGVN